MKKIIIIAALIVLSAFAAGCSNNSRIDYSQYTSARIDQGTAPYWEVPISACKDYGSQVQITTKTGFVILVDKTRVIFVKSKG